MADVLYLADYFSGEGGAADDSTDCTDAIQAALDDLIAANGGTLVLPAGVCQLAGDTYASFAGNEGIVKIVGNGSAIRFVNTGSDRMQFHSTSKLIFESVCFLGSMIGAGDEGGYEAGDAHFLCSGIDYIVLRDCQFFGMACGSARGIFCANSSFMVVENCQANGCTTVNGAIFTNTASSGFFARGLHCFDYAATGFGYVQKTQFGANWVKVLGPDPIPELWQARITSVASFEDCCFDEGGAVAMDVRRMLTVVVDKVSVNNSAGIGLYVLDAETVTVRNTIFGYHGLPVNGIVAENVEKVMLEGVRFKNYVQWLELRGTTGKLWHHDCDFQGNETYPRGIFNNSGARVIDAGVAVGPRGPN